MRFSPGWALVGAAAVLMLWRPVRERAEAADEAAASSSNSVAARPFDRRLDGGPALERPEHASETVPPHPKRGVSHDDFHIAYVLAGRHDPRVLRALVADLSRSVHAATARCGFERAAALGKGWPFVAKVAVELEVAAEVIRVRDVLFGDDDEEMAGGRVFKECFSSSGRTVEIACDGCRPGVLTLPWAFARFFAKPTVDGGVDGRDG